MRYPDAPMASEEHPIARAVSHPGDVTQWSRIKEIFTNALDRPEAERRQYVEIACGGNGQLQLEVESLLESDGAAGEFCEAAAARILNAFPPSSGVLGHRLQAGERLAGYVITRLVGAGGMGEVYCARDTRLGRDVAIKIVGSQFADAISRRRLMKEARHAATLSHPNICTIYEIGESGDVPFIAMEYIDGRPLGEICRGEGLSVAEAMSYASQIVGAVEHAHHRGIIHRDLKSSNVVVDAAGKATVLDFGLARRIPERESSSSAESFTTSGELAGTLSYMAPEVLIGGTADERSDIWAIGVLLYEMVAGELPFAGRTPFQTSSAIIGDDARPIVRRVPLGLRLVIQRCLMKDPASRYQNAAEIRSALGSINGTHTWTTTGGLLIRRHRLRLAVAAVVALASWGLLAGDFVGTPFTRGAAGTTLAVLPVENGTGIAGLDYYAQGITEALVAGTGALGNRNVRVVSRASAERVAQANTAAAAIAAALGVDTLVKGTLTSAGDRVQLEVSLVDGRSEAVVWSGRFDRAASEILALEADVVQAVAEGVQLAVASAARERLARVRAVDPNVYEAYLKGRYYWNLRTAESIQTAIAHFSRAVALDPTYAPAHAALADCYNQQATLMVGAGPPPQFRAMAATAAIRALQIDADSAEAHAALGYVRHYEWQWSDAERELRRAIALNPSNPFAHIWYANLLMSQRRMDEAVREVLLARDLDPFSPAVNANVGWVLVYARRPGEAIAQLTKTLQTNPDYAQARWRLVKALLLANRAQDAVVEAERVVKGGERSASALSVLAVASAHAGLGERARDLLGTLLRLAAREYVPPGTIADIYVALGDYDGAFPWMEKAYLERSNWIAYIAGDPANDVLRADPRFRSLLERLGLG
jgi:TolB-like protein/Flp pilus assembly protein TadD/predicted Ser/Thr protein kinase